MTMREKEDLVISFLKTSGEANYGRIKEYLIIFGCDKFGPSTLTSMVNRGLIEKTSYGYYKLPKVMKDDTMREFERKLAELEGHLNHLENSKSKWNSIAEEFALTADMDSYLSWNQAMYDELYKIYSDTKAEYNSYTERNSAF